VGTPRVAFAGLGVAGLAACGPAASRPAAIDNVATATDEVRVYAYNGTELVALYCARAGRLDGDRCGWTATLDLPLAPPRRLAGRRYARELDDGSRDTVVGYGAPRGDDAPVLVVERAGEVSVWVAPLRPGGDDLDVLPDASPTLVYDRAGVAVLPPAAGVGGLAKQERWPAVVLEVGGVEREIRVASRVAPIPYAVLDLDGDRAPEVTYLGHDDSGGFVEIHEVGDDPGAEADEAFSVRR
jgi:hypothetical protein